MIGASYEVHIRLTVGQWNPTTTTTLNIMGVEIDAYDSPALTLTPVVLSLYLRTMIFQLVFHVCV